ncbi:SAM-dependent methyltransferase [Actinomadura geliboluensis]|uniref:SAM-dependent methyltransferase n=1 Tax=Actinomadura geliboluensis TaxID=882440 RepID=UPI00371E6269
MYLRVLGGHVAVADGPEEDLEVLREQMRLLVTAWVVTERTLTVEQIQRVVWGDDGKDRRKELNTLLWDLRQRLPDDRVVTHGGRPVVDGYSLRLRRGVDNVDLWQFRSLVRRARAARARDTKEAANLFQRAMDLCGGPDSPLLPDRPKVNTLLVIEIERVLKEVKSAREALAELRLSLGEHEGFLPYLRGWVAADPWDEHLRRWLMVALYRSGAKAEALRVYRELEELLLSETGTRAEPGPLLKDTRIMVEADHPDLAPQPMRFASRSSWSLLAQGDAERTPSPPPVMDRPVVARIINALLGGKDNYEVDRVAAAAVQRQVPGLKRLIRHHQAFRSRAIREIAEAGVKQWIDLGSGLPDNGQVLPVVREVVPHARIVYVDNDPVVATHTRHELQDPAKTAFVEADLTDPPAVLNAKEMRDVIDFSKPVGILLTSVLHLFSGDVTGVMAAYVKAMAPGSYLVVSAVVSEGLPEKVVSVSREHFPLFHPRSHKEFPEWLKGLDVVAPGIIDCQHWRHPGTLPKLLNQRVLCAVAWKPGKETQRI